MLFWEDMLKHCMCMSYYFKYIIYKKQKIMWTRVKDILPSILIDVFIMSFDRIKDYIGLKKTNLATKMAAISIWKLTKGVLRNLTL